jgi:PhnB protein
MQINPYLMFNGNCEAAFKFYERCLGGKITIMLDHSTAPPNESIPADWRDKIMHARLEIGDQVLLASDAPPAFAQPTQGFNLNLNISDPAEAERIYHALAENGSVKMPFGQTFWAYRFGMLVDQFGIPWMINCETPA